jgi:hypothetical protein
VTHAVRMLRTHPGTIQAEADVLAVAIDACFDCAETCTACADACLASGAVEKLLCCVRLSLDCVDVCDATGKLLSRQSGPNADVVRAQVRACIAASRTCAEECQRHAARFEHCGVCADACRRCERACEDLVSGSPAPSS